MAPLSSLVGPPELYVQVQQPPSLPTTPTHQPTAPPNQPPPLPAATPTNQPATTPANQPNAPPNQPPPLPAATPTNQPATTPANQPFLWVNFFKKTDQIPPPQPPIPRRERPTPPPQPIIPPPAPKLWIPPQVQPWMGFTENYSATYLSSKNPCLDFFFHIVPDTPPRTLIKRLQLAWEHEPLTTLKLICHLRGVRGTGKSDKEGFLTAALWLYTRHPKTLATNVAVFATLGCFKDLPEILYRILEGPQIRQIQKSTWEQKKRRGSRSYRPKIRRRPSYKGGYQLQPMLTKLVISRESRQTRIAKNMARGKSEKAKASVAKKARKIAMAEKVIKLYSSDSRFRILYEQISDFFADCLKKDIKLLRSGESNKLSLAAKWCPSIDSSFDRATLICESIAKKVFPREEYPEYEGIEEAHYLYRVRDRLRKYVLVPIRRALKLPEVYIGYNRWDILPYNRVASVAMRFYKEKFVKHDNKRFSKYLEDVKLGKQKIAAGALLPHEIVESLEDYGGREVAELQWKRMVYDLLRKGTLNNCMAVCDVSGSMSGIPMEVSVALGVLVSELTEEPWKGKLITFSESPKLQKVEGDDLKSKTRFVKSMEWGMNTNFQRVFDLILQVAVGGKLKEDEMIKRLFVFSDMEFDQASSNPWETDYQAIVRKFTENGYGSAVPEIVFWNLRDSRATPVTGSQKGVALVSGYSQNMMTLFLEGNMEMTPLKVMEMAIAREEYQKLVVVD